MKAIILAAGKGERMLSLTAKVPAGSFDFVNEMSKPFFDIENSENNPSSVFLKQTS